jgi:MerR family mercuric resistance operon transcriptional regulator
MSAISIGELSNRSAVNIETIRYYERIKVMPSPPRTAGGHRVYDDDHAKRLSFVRRSRELGFSLKEVRQMLRLVDGGEVDCDQVREMTLEHLLDVQAKIADLKRMEKTLKETAARCAENQTPDCPIIEALFDHDGVIPSL